MANQPNSDALRDTIARLDASITEAQQAHDAAVAASRAAVTNDIENFAVNGGNGFVDVADILVPDVTATAARLEDLHRKREVAEYVLSRTLESEQQERDASDRATLSVLLNSHSDEMKLVDAAAITLADALARSETAATKVHNHIRLTMGRTPISGSPTVDTAQAVAAYIAQSQGWNAAPYKAAAATRADGFARNARNAAGLA